MSRFNAAIFDMDGLLIDSEPLWQEAEKKVFSTVGIQLTTSMCETTMGMRLDEVVKHWHSRYPWNGRSLEQVETEVLNEVEQLIGEKGMAMPGTGYIISLLKQHSMKLAVASSSYLRLIEKVLEKLAIRNHFDSVHSAQFEEKGKPHPGIYLSAARSLGIHPGRCIAFEDSYNGILSAKAAGMFTVAVPAPQHFDDPGFSIADVKIRSLEDFGKELL